MAKFNRYDIEEIILGMADIVEENRQLRFDFEQVEIMQRKQHEFVDNLVKEHQKADRDFLKMILENALMGGNDNDD